MSKLTKPTFEKRDTAGGHFMRTPDPAPLANLERVVELLASSRDLHEVRQVRDMAEAARLYAVAIQRGLEAQNHAAEIKIRAERRAGELLAEMELKPGRPKQGNAPSLGALGIEHHESERWQQMATLSESRFEAHVEQVKASGQELTSAGVYALARPPRPMPEANSRDTPAMPLLRFCQADLPTPTIVTLILRVMFPDAADALDVTYGNGLFWDGTAHVTVTGHDVDAQRAPDGALDFTRLPYHDTSIDVVLFDPPHLADAGADSIMGQRFGTLKASDLREAVGLGVREAWRIARLGIVVRIADHVHGQQFVSETDWVRSALDGMLPYDVVHQTRSGALVDPTWEGQASAYNNGSSYLIFRRGNQRHLRR